MVDAPAQQWNGAIDTAFDDGGEDAFAKSPAREEPATSGPRFFRER